MIMMATLAMVLLATVEVLYNVTGIGKSEYGAFNAIAVLISFTTIFAAGTSMLTLARPHEVVASSLTFGAVLFIMISNFTP
jgi:hypothetical protein